jgi:PadR family transcriptional regulator, regulatory protein PadR
MVARRRVQMADQISREIHLAFWKIHILHHAGERPIYGQWLLEELRRHGFAVSPGTLYPLLARMEHQGWLRAGRRAMATTSPKARREYVLTSRGARALAGLRRQVEELHREVVQDAKPKRG